MWFIERKKTVPLRARLRRENEKGPFHVVAHSHGGHGALAFPRSSGHRPSTGIGSLRRGPSRGFAERSVWWDYAGGHALGVPIRPRRCVPITDTEGRKRTGAGPEGP